MYLHSPVLEVGSWWRVDTASGTNTPTTVYVHDGADAIPTALGASGSTVRGNTRDGTGLFWSSAATLYCKELTYQGVPTGTVVTSTGVTPTTPSGAPVDIATISKLVAALPTTYVQLLVTDATSTTLTGTLTAGHLSPVDCTAGAGARTLPAAASVAAGTPAVAKKADSSANSLVVSRAGSDLIFGTGAGATSKTLTLSGEAVTFVSNGVDRWSIESSDTPSGAIAATYAPIAATPVASSATSGTLTAAAEHNLSPTSAAAWTLPTSVTATRLPTTVKNNGTATITVAHGGSDTINGGTASVSIAAGEWARFTSDGSGAWTQSGTAGQSATYAIKGRRSLSVYDEFSRYANGALSGNTPLIGSAWSTSGAQPTTVTSGKATSTGTGYAAQILAATVRSIACEIVWSGTGTNQALALIASTDSTITISNAVHFNLGPAGFTLTVRKDAGTFDNLLFGNWRQAMKVDGATVYRVGMLIRGNTVAVLGPNGEQYTATDPRVGLLAGTMAVWEPNTSSGTVANLVSAAATSEASTGSDFPYGVTGDNSAAGLLMGPQGQASGNRNTRTEVSIGTDNTSGLPALTFGPLGAILGVLQADAASGATSISTDVYIPTGSTVQLESGTNTETVTASSNSTGSGPYATTVGATTKTHVAGIAVVITVPASYIAKFTSNAGTVTAPASVIFTNVYGAGQTVRLTQGASGVWDTSSSVGTGKGAFITGKNTTGNRPAASAVGAGAQFYDTTLSKPIWSDGTNWKDATGTNS